MSRHLHSFKSTGKGRSCRAILAGLGLVIVLSLLSWRTDLAFAQTDATIAGFRVEGNQRIEDQTVISYLKVVIGDRFDSVKIDQSLKDLFATGLFADVRMRRSGSTLVVDVSENPMVNRIAFEGNLRLEDDALAQEVQMRPRVVYTRTKVQQDVTRLLDLYRASGRFAATVEPKVIKLEQNRVDLIYEIKEGPLTGIQRINFIGNQVYSDGTLRELIATKQTRWWRFLTVTDTYDPDRLSFDRELLRRFYLKEGYADFRVIDAVAELTPDRENFFVTFTIDEGARYQVGDIEVDVSLPDLQAETLWDSVITESGDWYNADLVEDTIQKLTDAVGSKGYAFVDVRPRVSRDAEERQIDIVYEIGEGARVYVERIDIAGNVRTLDRIIRRNVRLVEGDAFNSAKLRRSRQLVQNLGFFGNVDINNIPGDEPDQTIVRVNVTEQSTGEVNFGGGFSTAEGLIASTGIRERNLLGRGQDLSVNFTISTVRQDIILGFTEPYFLNRDVEAGFDIFNTDQEFSESSFDRDVTGFTLRGGYPLAEFLSQDINYSLRREDITPDVGASQSIIDDAGINLISVIGQSMFYDKLDDRINPTDGFFVEYSSSLAGLGGERNWIRNRLEGGHYFPIAEGLVFSTIAEAGFIFGLQGDDVEITDRFFLGGSSFRGFQSAGVGPRDLANSNALGGNLLYKATAELLFPLGLPDELGLSGRAFAVAGSLAEVDESDFSVADTGSLRASVGVGLSWASPFGPVRLDLALPVLKEEFDETELVSFGFGSFF